MAPYLTQHSSLFVPDSIVNYECMITNSINCLLIGSKCIPNGTHTLIIIESIWPMLQNSDQVCNRTAHYADSCIDKAIKWLNQAYNILSYNQWFSLPFILCIPFSFWVFWYFDQNSSALVFAIGLATHRQTTKLL